jgi:hypothetical protein
MKKERGGVRAHSLLPRLLPRAVVPATVAHSVAPSLVLDFPPLKASAHRLLTSNPIAIGLVSIAAYRFGRTFFSLSLSIRLRKGFPSRFYQGASFFCTTNTTTTTTITQFAAPLPTTLRRRKITTQHQLPRYQLLSLLTSRHLFRAFSSPAHSTSILRSSHHHLSTRSPSRSPSAPSRPVHPDHPSLDTIHTPPVYVKAANKRTYTKKKTTIVST